MSGLVPKLNLIYYKALADKCFERFCSENNSSFSKVGNEYVLAEAMTKAKLKKTLKLYLADELIHLMSKDGSSKLDWLLVIGGCMPKDSLLLKCRSSGDVFPKKLDSILNADFQIKYFLREHDIKVDLVQLNEVIAELFNDLFLSRRAVIRMLGEAGRKVMFVQHQHLDCYIMFKAIKSLYGRTNCCNLYKERFRSSSGCLVAVNDIVDRCIKGRQQLNSMPEFKKAIKEVKQFIDERMMLS